MGSEENELQELPGKHALTCKCCFTSFTPCDMLVVAHDWGEEALQPYRHHDAVLIRRYDAIHSVAVPLRKYTHVLMRLLRSVVSSIE